MKIKSLRIENLRSFVDVTVPFDNYTCLVGPNGAGKSTILCALNIFFRESENAATNLIQLNSEDFHQKRTENPIRITITFKDLSAEAQQDFADYFRQGKLVVSAVATFDKDFRKSRGETIRTTLRHQGFRQVLRCSWKRRESLWTQRNLR